MRSVDLLAWIKVATTGLHCLHEGSNAARRGHDALIAASRLLAAAEVMAALMPDAELETDAVQGEIVANLRAAIANCEAYSA